MAEGTLLGCIKANFYAIDRCEDRQHIGFKLVGQLRGAEVFINHGFDTMVAATIRYNRHTATTSCHHQYVTGNQGFDGFYLYNAARLGRWHHSAPATASVFLNGKAALTCLHLGFGLGVERANWLGWILEGRVACVDLCLHHHRYRATHQAGVL